MSINELELNINGGAEENNYKVKLTYSDEPLPTAKPGSSCLIFDQFARLESVQVMVRDLQFDNEPVQQQTETWVVSEPTGLDMLIVEELITRDIIKPSSRIYTSLDQIEGPEFNFETEEKEARNWLSEHEPTTVTSYKEDGKIKGSAIHVPSSIPKHDEGE